MPPGNLPTLARCESATNCASADSYISPSGERSIWLRHDRASFKQRFRCPTAGVIRHELNLILETAPCKVERDQGTRYRIHEEDRTDVFECIEPYCAGSPVIQR